MKSPKIAVVCPIGHLDRHGYQHVYRPCFASMAAFAGTVYLVQSVRSTAGMGHGIAMSENIVRVSGEDTWFDMVDGEERFDLERIGANINLGLEMARADGFQVAVVVESNQYIPGAARKPLANACRAMLKAGQPYAWLYRRDQLIDVTFHANLRRPWIFNLGMGAQVQQPDGTLYAGLLVRHERGNWPEYDAAALVDCPLEMSLADLTEKMTYVRSLREYVPKRPAVFDWGYWRNYSVAKFRQKVQDGAALDEYGQEIAALSAAHPEFLSHEVLGLL